jgi:hypothetical protein
MRRHDFVGCDEICDSGMAEAPEGDVMSSNKKPTYLGVLDCVDPPKGVLLEVHEAEVECLRKELVKTVMEVVRLKSLIRKLGLNPDANQL